LADEAPADEKTEAPTDRRRQRAREKGDRLTSRELSTATAGIAGALWLWLAGERLAEGLRASARGALDIGRAEIADFRPLEAMMLMLAPLAPPLLALAGMLLAAAALGQALSGGIALSSALVAPKAERLDPVKGLGRLFGRKGLVELAKAVLKATLLVGVSAALLAREAPALSRLSAMPLEAAFRVAASAGLALFLWLSLGLVLIAAGDVPMQLRQWLQRLRMTKQELRDEQKEDGSPEMKAAIRRLQRDSLKRASRAAVSQATVVLTNPTHFAVALRYRPGLDAAPLVIARGRGVVADVIRELAAEAGVATLAYPSVARAIFFTGRVGRMIRPDLFPAVAAILAYVLRAGGRPELPPEVEAPETAWFDEAGRATA
jgi:flagellar biosynthetic protein FlhB